MPFPNPEEGKSALKLAIETAENNGSRIILANDPDADRLAVAEHPLIFYINFFVQLSKYIVLIN